MTGLGPQMREGTRRERIALLWRQVPSPSMPWVHQLAEYPGKSKRLLGTWHWDWKCRRPEGTEMGLNELVQGKFEERDRKIG